MTEATTATPGAEQTQTAEQGAQSGEPTLEQLLQEGRKGMSQTTAKPEKKSEQPSVPDPQQIAADVRASLKAEAEFGGIAADLAKGTGVSEKTATAMLTGDLTTDPALQAAWFARGQNPAHWEKVKAAYLKERSGEFKGVAAKVVESVPDRAAVRAAARTSPSAQQTPDVKPDIRNDARARSQFLRNLGIRA